MPLIEVSHSELNDIICSCEARATAFLHTAETDPKSEEHEDELRKDAAYYFALAQRLFGYAQR